MLQNSKVLLFCVEWIHMDTHSHSKLYCTGVGAGVPSWCVHLGCKPNAVGVYIGRGTHAQTHTPTTVVGVLNTHGFCLLGPVYPLTFCGPPSSVGGGFRNSPPLDQRRSQGSPLTLAVKTLCAPPLYCSIWRPFTVMGISLSHLLSLLWNTLSRGVIFYTQWGVVYRMKRSQTTKLCQNTTCYRPSVKIVQCLKKESTGRGYNVTLVMTVWMTRAITLHDGCQWFLQQRTVSLEVGMYISVCSVRM